MCALTSLVRPLRQSMFAARRGCPGLGQIRFKSLPSRACEVEDYLHSIRHTLPTKAQQMLSDGVLQKCDSSGYSPSGTEILTPYLMQCQNAEERHETVVCFSLLLNRYRLSRSCCEACLYPKARCICKHVKKVVPQHKLWIFQHVGEYGRNNNTGSLLCLMAGAERTIRGIRDQQERMMEHVSRNRFSTVVLFPNSKSITVDEYLGERPVRMGSAEDDPLTLILLDGTSRQAKNFDKFMPADIPRIRIKETSLRSWLDPIRRQTEEHRVCTAQAAAMILEELGDSEASDAIESAVQNVLEIAEMKRYAVSTNERPEKRYPSTLFT